MRESVSVCLCLCLCARNGYRVIDFFPCGNRLGDEGAGASRLQSALCLPQPFYGLLHSQADSHRQTVTDRKQKQGHATPTHTLSTHHLQHRNRWQLKGIKLVVLLRCSVLLGNLGCWHWCGSYCMSCHIPPTFRLLQTIYTPPPPNSPHLKTIKPPQMQWNKSDQWCLHPTTYRTRISHYIKMLLCEINAYGLRSQLIGVN